MPYKPDLPRWNDSYCPHGEGPIIKSSEIEESARCHSQNWSWESLLLVQRYKVNLQWLNTDAKGGARLSSTLHREPVAKKMEAEL